MKGFTKSVTIHTTAEELRAITREVQAAVRESGVQEGICVVYCPHTTAGLTINENYDPDVARDLLFSLSSLCPDRPEYRHAEGNSAAHLKASLMGSSVTLLIQEGALLLGRWQGIYFCEFDGPRQRSFQIPVQGE